MAKSLKTVLAGKATSLHTKSETQAQAAQNFLAASAQAQAEAQTAAKHAAAVEQALAVLDEAGVVL